MLKLLPLALGLFLSAIYLPNAQANSFRYRPLLERLNWKLQAQTIKPIKKSTTIEKVPIKTGSYQQIRLQENTRNQVDCQKFSNGGRIGSGSDNIDYSNPYRNYTVGGAVRLDGSANQKCTAELKLPTPTGDKK